MKRIIKAAIPVVALAIFLFVLLVVITRAQSASVIASGGVFTLEKAAIAGGGMEKPSGLFSENGTAAQALAGTYSSGGQYSIYSGFWTPDDFAPTAAGVLISGRIRTSNGVGIRNVTVTLANQSGETRTALSSSLGYYSFEDVQAGETYLISVTAKGHTFAEPTRVRHAVDDISDLDFIAEPMD